MRTDPVPFRFSETPRLAGPTIERTFDNDRFTSAGTFESSSASIQKRQMMWFGATGLADDTNAAPPCWEMSQRRGEEAMTAGMVALHQLNLAFLT